MGERVHKQQMIKDKFTFKHTHTYTLTHTHTHTRVCMHNNSSGQPVGVEHSVFKQ